ncbi:WecB/TagA/CpsF family glycosyltransferase [Parasphingopyxis sp. CP4]|uniref:WecB/TagA/CpsF family glycosyltransferase n=1 Tax=Parasphingopyxis sp. CP4 TaxID=2724527 RepID=UPI0015A43419|nr:WecB/TagA/CpsF family glycosyltransferase [Parasphingopyxis sp. CP4]QLC22454.1 WecB/TagA/CpsF family glycosyltransferase [Parasphingopyxis sp. CP4]
MTTASRADLVDALSADCAEREQQSNGFRTRLVFDANGHGLSLAGRDKEFRNALGEADIVHADGGFLIPASRWFAGAPITERSATTDLFHDFARRAETEDLSFYLLGGTEEVNEQCAARMGELYPCLNIVGRRHGYFEPPEEADIVAAIADAAPDILWIGLGKPKEQFFAVRHRDALNATWAVTCGGCYNYVTGHYRRAPKWMQRMHLEWLHRALTNPSLIGRYLTSSPHALWLIVRRRDRGLATGRSDNR